jgi:hypothetical protein
MGRSGELMMVASHAPAAEEAGSDPSLPLGVLRMSTPTHRAPRKRSSSRKGIGVFTAVLALIIGSASAALAADGLQLDGDTAAPSGNVSYGTGANDRACNTRGQVGQDVPGEITINFNGNAANNSDHFNSGEALTVTFYPSDANVSASVTGSTTVPDGWDSSTDSFTIPFATTVGTSAVSSSVGVKIAGADYAVGLTEGSGRPHFNVSIDCGSAPVNHAPTVGFTSPPTSTDEGTATPFSFSVSDPDAGNSWSFAPGYPDCGSGAVSAATTTPSTSTTGTFSCTFPDGVPGAPAETVAVQLVDGAGAASNLATTDVTVNNVTPVVTAGTLDLISVDCRTVVTLGGISFTDPGDDDPWDVTIDWGDNSTDTTFPVSAAGGIDDQTHNYVTPGGPYTVTVSVKDKDGAEGSDTSNNTVTVLQTYSVDFLPPFDDSSPSGLIVNKMKNGRVVPVKATIYDDCAQSYVTDPTTAVSIKTSKTSGTGIGDPVEEYADAGASASNTNLFRWSADATAPGGGFWIYNLDSKALGLIVGSNYRVDIYVGGSPTTGTKATVDDWAVLQPVK